MLQAASRKFVAKRAQQHVRVGGGHDLFWMERTLVLLHGFTHTGATWGPVIRALGERYNAIAPDIRGHGAASGREPVDLDGVIEDIDRLVEGGRFTLAGYSMGGRIALHAALVLRGRIERLVLIGASPGIADAHERDVRLQSDEQLADWIEREESIEKVARRWERTPVLEGQPPEVAKFVHENRLLNTPAGLARALRGLGTGALPSAWEHLGELGMPVKLIVGEEDRKFKKIAEQMTAAIDWCDVIVVPGVGHAVHLEDPEAVAQVLRKPSLRLMRRGRRR
jgi:2-succinyl-6-hydroxy-2,4-cyclohexadiene-1-carboxylate synthase